MAKAKAPRQAATTARRDPLDHEKKSVAAAVARVITERESRAESQSPLPSLKAEWGGSYLAVNPPHNDSHGWSAQLTESLGANDPRAADFLLSGAANAGFGPKPVDQATADVSVRGTESALAFVSDMQPRNALEAMLLLQMTAMHNATMTLARHASRADVVPILADHNRMMNQTARTTATLAEAFHKLRTGGKQQVEVRYVYVDARTQTVVNQGGGQGGALPDLQQPHGPALGALGYAPAEGLPMRSADASGDTLSVASDQRETTLPDARRQEPRRASGRRERQLQSGPVDARDDSRTGPGPRARKAVSGNTP